MTSYIDIDTAARRSGKSTAHLSRTAAQKWAAEGKAQKRRTESGQSKWFIREDADASLAPVKFADQMQIDLRQYTQVQRDEAFRRRDLLTAWDRFCRSAFDIGFDRVRATNTFVERQLLEHGVKVSSRTLYNWQKAYRAEGLAGLIDGRTERGKDMDAVSKDAAAFSSGVDPFFAEVQRLYLTKNQPKLANVHRIVVHTAAQHGWTVRSYKACQRYIDKLPAGLLVKYRLGEDAYVAKAEPYIERDYTTLESNEAWTADHHQMDVIVNFRGELLRPWLSVFMDIRSRKIVGWAIFDHAPNSDVIISIFNSAVRQHGKPKNLFLDNGKDYDCFALNGRTKRDRWTKSKIKIVLEDERAQGIFPRLDVKVHHVWAYHGQSKPVEPWFKNPEEANRCWPTYCGNSPDNKPEDLQLQQERGKAPLLEDYVAWFGEWLAAHDAGHQHQGSGMDGKTPDRVFAENLRCKEVVNESLLDLLCLKRVGPVKVGRNGVQWQGLRFGQYEPAISRLLGEEVYLRIDVNIAGHVQVYSAADDFICIAPSNEQLPYMANQQHLRQAIGKKKQNRKLLKTYIDQRPRLADDLPDLMIQAAAAAAQQAQRDNPTPPPTHSIKPHRDPLEAALPAIQRAVEQQQLRQAVGSESTPVPGGSGRFIYQKSETIDTDTGEAHGGMTFRELMAGREASMEDEL